MKELNIDGNEYIKFTERDAQHCFTLIDTKASPSDLGYDFTAAAILLSTFTLVLQNILKQDNISPEYRRNTEDLIEKTSELSNWSEPLRLDTLG